MKLLVIDPGMRLWGSERALLATLPALIAGNESLTLMIPRGSELGPEAAKLGVKVEAAPIGLLHRKGLLAKAWALARIIAACRRHDVDAIYLNQAGLCRLVHAVGRLLGRPLVIHVRLAEDLPRCARLRPRPRASLSLVFVSNDMARRYAVFAPPNDPKQLITAYDVAHMPAAADASTSKRRPSVACLGRLEEGKGQRELIEALGLLLRQGHPLPAELIGALDEEDEYVRSLRARISELELDSSVVIRGYLPGASDCLAAHSFAVVSSKYESFGRVVPEAWAAGTLPIVSAASGGAAELVSASGGGLLFEGHSPEQLALALSHAQSLAEADRNSMIERGRAWARAHLSVEAYRGALDGVLFDAANGLSPPRITAGMAA